MDAEKQVELHSLTFTQTGSKPHEIAKSRTAKGAVTFRRLKGTAEVAAVQWRAGVPTSSRCNTGRPMGGSAPAHLPRRKVATGQPDSSLANDTVTSYYHSVHSPTG